MKANSNVKQNALRAQIKSVEDNERLARMHASQLQDEQEKLQARIDRVNAEFATTDIHSTLLARGTVQIRRNGK